ncbi:MAG: MFS transporter [Vicinamibacteraceae bacterium]|nr:MFS transporter [Vicinamibacteraceae bacterium]
MSQKVKTLPTPYYRRNLFAVTAATFIGFMGFTLVMPFLPLYFEQLGLDDPGAIALWSGLTLGVTPAMTAVLSPLWGRLADRFGRKIMVERSLLSFVVIMAATAYVSEPWHVFALRCVQGFFAGYGALALTMAADSAPQGRMAGAIGTVQVAQRLGPAFGPVIGGVVAELVGLRRAFLVAACFYAAGFLLVLFMYREDRASGQRASVGRDTAPLLQRFREVLTLPRVAGMMAAMFVLQLADRSFGPVLPLYVAQHGTEGSRVALVSGVLFSLIAGAGALGNVACGRLMKRYRPSRVILVSSGVGAVGALIYAVWPSPLAMGLGSLIFGAGIGVAMTATYTVAGEALPVEGRATGFGFITSASLAGLALSPMLAGLLAARSIRAVFVLDVVVLVALAGIIGHRTRGATVRARDRVEGPGPSDLPL